MIFTDFFTSAKKVDFYRFSSNFKLSHRALYMSDFRAMGLFFSEMIHIFQFITWKLQWDYLHALGTHQAHQYFFDNSYQNAVPGVCMACAYMCAWCVQILKIIIPQKYGSLRFQRWLARSFTMKTRLLEAIWNFIVPNSPLTGSNSRHDMQFL